jgi:glycine/D-amino acid oxidase-like deaminating enzyme
MDRRTLITRGGLGVVGLGLGLAGCATGGSARASRPARRLTPVDARWERVIRTTVGLRPYRPSGFVVRAERLGEKLLVHNYGHGGAGMSLSWGTGQIAAELALERPERRAAVVGCGVCGLTTARQLQRRGFQVTVYADTVPPNTTSNMSFAGWTPLSGLVQTALRTPEWDARFRRAASIAYTQLQLLVGAGYGVSWLDEYALSDSVGQGGGGDGDGAPVEPLLPPELRVGSTLLGPGEHPFPTRWARHSARMRIEPSIYLDALVADVLRAGASSTTVL